MSSELDELKKLIDDVKFIPEEIKPQARKIVHDSTAAIERDWKQRWNQASWRHLPDLARSITMEVSEAPGEFTGEVGPDKHLPQGRLGSFIEFGTRTSGPHPGGWPAADVEEPNFIENVERIKILELGP